MSNSMLAVLQLSSPALPIGAFSYSQGLETAVARGLVCDESTLQQWVEEGLASGFGLLELPVWCLQYVHWSADKQADAFALDQWFLATRETQELRLETEQMGWSAQALLRDWAGLDTARNSVSLRWPELHTARPIALPTVMSALAVLEGIEISFGAAAYAFAWSEAQVMAGSKAIPLGQAAIQRIVRALRGHCVAAAERGLTMDASQLQTFSPGLAILSSQHETQYTRLFRS